MPSKKVSKKVSTKRGISKKIASPLRGGAVPPYGPPIREAMARGDAAEMRKVAASARKWINDAQAALEKLEAKLGQVGSKKK